MNRILIIRGFFSFVAFLITLESGSISSAQSLPIQNPDPGSSSFESPVANGTIAQRIWFESNFFYAAGQATNVPAVIRGNNPTDILVGGHRLGNDFRPGLALSVGTTFGANNQWGIDASYFFLGRQSDNITLDPTVPGFVNTVGIAGLPLRIDQNAITISSNTGGTDVNLRKSLWENDTSRIDLIGGYRFLSLSDELTISGQYSAGFPQTNVVTFDHISTSNSFHGGQLGVSGIQTSPSGFSLNWQMTCALGQTNATAFQYGTQAAFGHPVNLSLFQFLSENPRSVDRRFFAVVPEARVRLDYEITPGWHVSLGYRFTYWSSVLRAGDQRPLPAPAGGEFADIRKDFWIQGITIGLTTTW